MALRGVYAAKLRAWKAFAAFIRARDRICYTSGHPTTEAGHFLHNTDKPNKSLGGNLLWFDERNVHGQCPYCNRHRSGNTAVYSVRLVEQYGDGILAELYRLYRTPKKWTLEELAEIEQKYIKKLEEL